MARRAAKTLTEGEQRLMTVLWDRGASTVTEVVASLDAPVPAYTSVLTMLGILERKGFVRRNRAGKAHVYRAAIDRDRATRTIVTQLLANWFGGSPQALMQSLLASESLSRADVEQLRERIEKGS